MAHTMRWSLRSLQPLSAVAKVVSRARAACSTRSPASSRARSFSTGFFEYRQYDISPAGLTPYMAETEKNAALRKELFDTDKSRWMCFMTTEIGPHLTRVHHLYKYTNFDSRDNVRAAAGADARWSGYLKTAKPHMTNQSSLIYIEATETLKAAGLGGAMNFQPQTAASGSRSAVYELRRYQLRLGYPTVPEFLKNYGAGLLDKLRADDSGASTLVTLLYNEVGPLNTVLELWRHESMERSQDSRVASRNAPLWKQAVGKNAELGLTFDNQFLKPAPFSPWQ